ncbi:MAG: hypothetical protein A2252_10810 [Elusimicrobia bacterium RIFOXYA2_FULL_39_19]|nr:MAG: hypothetical protein A2252_10810 [Elusimicrobia bacterium RIFOXYA2_FULL_39_19]
MFRKQIFKLLSQFIFLFLFIFLFIQTGYNGEDLLKYPVNLFFRFDPLVFLNASIASRTIAHICLLSLIIIILSLFLGRFYCWWVCPLGTLFDYTSLRKKRLIPPNLKYYVLIFVTASSLLTLQFTWLFDPNSILIRTLSVFFVEKNQYSEIYRATAIIFFVLLMLLNLFGKRAWCNGICPLGAIYSLTAKLKVKEKKLHYENLSLSKRSVLLSLAGAVFVLPVIKSIKNRNPFIPALRPPGADKKDFLRKCIRCGECWKVCPNKALYPAIFETGAEGIYSPVFKMRLGWCEYNCNLCGQVCPTGAIPNYPIDERKKCKIGLAEINKRVCLPWAEKTNCFVCEEHCPIPDKAIKLEIDIDNIKKPYVDKTLCVGCGICETKCPVTGDSAIVVKEL